jgi:hypothetical protein
MTNFPEARLWTAKKKCRRVLGLLPLADCMGVDGFAATLFVTQEENTSLSPSLWMLRSDGAEGYSQRNATIGSTREARRAGM